MSVYLRDPRLQGVAYAAVPNTTQVAVVCPLRRVVAMVRPQSGTITYQGEAAVPLTPGAIVADASFLYVLAQDTIYKLTVAATPVLSATISLAVNTLRNYAWAFLVDGRLLAPWGSTGAQLLSTAGTVLASRPSLLARVDRAAYDPVNRRLYLIDGDRGQGVVLAVGSAGTLTYKGAFLAPNVKPVTGMAVDGSTLVITTDHRLMTFILADVDAPAFATSTTYAQTINGIVVLSTGRYWLATTEGNSVQAYPYTFGDFAALIGPTGLMVLHSTLARVSTSNPATSIGGTSVSLPSLPNLNALSFNGAIRTILIIGSALYIGGDFTSVTDATGAQARTRLCAVDLSTGLLTSWAPACDGGVYALCTDGANVYIGGLFNNAGGSGRVNLAAFVLGGALTSWNPGANNIVQALAYLGGVVYVGGQFTTLAATGRNFAGAVSTAGVIQAWAPDPNASVFCIAISGTSIYLGGGFSQLKGATINRSRGCVTDTAGAIGAWNAQANTGYIYGMQIVGTLIYIAGTFSAINGTARLFAAVIDTSSVLQVQSPTADNIAQAVAVDASLNFYVGGFFTNLQSTARRFAGSVDPANGLRSWDPGLTGGTVVYAFAVSAPYLIIGGAFTNPSGGTNFYVMPAA